jgi:hypothetical protein
LSNISGYQKAKRQSFGTVCQIYLVIKRRKDSVLVQSVKYIWLSKGEKTVFWYSLSNMSVYQRENRQCFGTVCQIYLVIKRRKDSVLVQFVKYIWLSNGEQVVFWYSLSNISGYQTANR